MKKYVSCLAILLLIFAFTGCDLQEEEIKRVKIEDIVDKLEFSTVDIDGNPVTSDIFKDAKVIMVNYWEPWCGPCVGEMPELEELYENYKDQGFLILGVFSSTDMKSEAKQVLEECNISYPVVLADSNLEKYMTDYVPTTIFVDSEGRVISKEPVVGANSLSDWEEIVEEYLK